MKTIYSSVLTAILLSGLYINAQSKCSTMQILEKRIKQDPALKFRRELSEIETQNLISVSNNFKNTQIVVTIPVVVHVLYNNATQNISLFQILSQIDILNLDFRLLNIDALNGLHPFWPVTADAQIQFCLASRDPSGAPTTGVTRTFTDSISFLGIGSEKYSVTGGINNWDPTKYLNLWVCDLSASGGTLGYAAFPSDLATSPSDDGVVISYTAFGNIGTATAPNNLGRTATHEVGHWLNLSHIWGDAICGDDFVADTEIAEDNNFGCPTFPHNSNSTCGAGPNGEMYMNYMDYVDDYCMVMFTDGQATRMHAALSGDRLGLLSSLGCTPVSGLSEVSLENIFSIYPNPSNTIFTVDAELKKNKNLSIDLCDLLGNKILQFQNVVGFPFQINISDLATGSYFVNFRTANYLITKKVFITK